MKIEIGESLMLSWLRHIKHCQSVQLNWKASVQTWELNNEARLQEIMKVSKMHFERHYGYDIYKGTSSCQQFLKQGEIDVLGLKIDRGIVTNIYGVDIAFHEGGLSYGGVISTSEKIIKKMVRTAMLIHGFYNMSEGTIIFASPKIHKSLEIPIQSAIKELNKLLSEMGFSFSFLLYANRSFKEEIFEPVVKSTKSVADTSELFLRSIQMYNLFSTLPSHSLPYSDVIEEAAEPMELPPATYVSEIKIGELVRNEIAKLISLKLLTPEKVKLLTDEIFSKETFGVNYPFLKKITSDKSLIDQRQINGYPRYWSKVYIINGERYFLCNDWYERNTPKFKEWVSQFQ
jgi:hypothetical protein